ncbi:unnamed protein product [Pylaiella littoralis]
MAGISDISSDEISEHEAEIGPAAAPTARSAPALLVPRPPRHRPPPPHYHHSKAGSVSSESESDVRPHHRHQLLQPPRPPPPLPSSSSGPGAAPPPAIAARSAGNATPAATRGGQEQQQHPTGTQVNFQLVPCKACAASSSFAHCLSAKSKNGERHVPRLRLVKGQALRKRCKSLLVRGQRDDLPTRTSLMGVAPEPEDGSTEALPLTPENLALRFRIPCRLCTTLAMCSNQAHPHKIETLAEMMQLPADDVEESQEDEKRGDRSSKGGASLLESQQGWAKSRRRVWEVEGERVMMPNMISICDGVVLSLYLAPISIFSERRADVAGDFGINADMGDMSRGGYHFARMPIVNIANVLKLRALRDVISWKHNPDKSIHPIVAAKVMSVYERHHPAETKRLDALLKGGKHDKDLRFELTDGSISAVVFKASELRAVFARRSTEAFSLIAEFTEEQLHATATPGREYFYERDLLKAGREETQVAGEGGASGGGGGGGDGIRRGKLPLDSSGSAAAAAATRTKRAYRRRSTGPSHSGSGSGGGGRAGAERPSLVNPSSSAASCPKPRRTRVKAVVASDGKCYCLPLCIREKAQKLNLYVSLRTHRVNGDTLFTDPSSEGAPLQRPYGRAEITRENILGLRGVRDLVYRNPSMHPVIAADAFEIWENAHSSDPPKHGDDDDVVVAGAMTADGVIPEGKFKAGELRKLRGAERRVAVEELLETQLRSSSVMGGVLEETAAPSPLTVDTTGPEEAFGRGSGAGPKKKRKRKEGESWRPLRGGGTGGTGGGDKPASAVVSSSSLSSASSSSASSSSASSSTSSPERGEAAVTAAAAAATEASRAAGKRKNKSSSRLGDSGTVGGPAAASGGGGGGGGGTSERSPKRRSRGGQEEGDGGGSRSRGGETPKGNDEADDDDAGGGGYHEQEGGVEGEQDKRHQRAGGAAGAGGAEAEGQGSGGSLARVRRASWLEAVHENDNHLKQEQERLRREKARAKDAHLARSVELMKWMVDEQSGRHEGSAGPPPRR